MSDLFETIFASLSPALGWLTIAIIVLLALLFRKPPRRGKRTID